MKKKRRGSGKYHEWLTKEGLLKLEGWARDGLTDEQIAHNIGIVPSTLYEWKRKYSEISEALKKGKEVIDREVENALLKRALGYEYEETTKERVLKKDIKGQPMTDLHGFPVYEMVTTKKVKKEVVPDTTAQIFWLKNRKPEQWRDKRDVSVDGNIDTRTEKLDSILKQLKED